MIELIKYALSDLWKFIGFSILMTAVFRFLFLLWNRLIRHLNIRAAGWPPEHLDADGSFSADDEEDD